MYTIYLPICTVVLLLTAIRQNKLLTTLPIKLNVSKLWAHLFIFYFSLLSAVPFFGVWFWSAVRSEFLHMFLIHIHIELLLETVCFGLLFTSLYLRFQYCFLNLSGHFEIGKDFMEEETPSRICKPWLRVVVKTKRRTLSPWTSHVTIKSCSNQYPLTQYRPTHVFLFGFSIYYIFIKIFTPNS